MTQNTKIVSYKEAFATGVRHYFTGRACKRGHVDQRFVTNRQCGSCLREDIAARRARDPAAINAQKRANYARAPEAHRQRALAHYRANTVARSEYAKTRRARYLESYKTAYKSWARANVQRVRYYANKRRCAKLERTPAWADLVAIKAFYDACPAGHQVDHILPLRGRRISGLHVLENLQYLPDAENMSKGNRFTPYMVLHD